MRASLFSSLGIAFFYSLSLPIHIAHATTPTATPSCVQEGGGLGAVVPGNNLRCCQGLVAYIPHGITGSAGTCVKPESLCVKEGESLGALSPFADNSRTCCAGLLPYFTPGYTGTQGTCEKPYTHRIVSIKTNLRSSPRIGKNTLMTLTKGQQVTSFERVGHWCKVRLMRNYIELSGYVWCANLKDPSSK